MGGGPSLPYGRNADMPGTGRILNGTCTAAEAPPNIDRGLMSCRGAGSQAGLVPQAAGPEVTVENGPGRVEAVRAMAISVQCHRFSSPW